MKIVSVKNWLIFFQITQEDFSSTIELLESLITKILTASSNHPIGNNTNGNVGENASHTREENASDKRGFGLKAVLRFLQTISSSPEDKWDSSYRMHIGRKLIQHRTGQSNIAERPTHETTLHFWCLNPEIR